MSVGSLRMVAARAQDETQSLIFPNGNELIWVDPWSEAEDPAVEQVLPSYVGLSGGSQGEFIVGYYDAPTTIGEAVEAFLASLLEDPSIAVNIAGGGEQSVIEGTEVRKDYLLHRAVAGDVEWGLYFQLVDGVELTVFTGPVSAFASEMESAHASITLNGEGVLAGVDGAEFQRQLESPVMREPGGEYTNAAGTVRVRWNAGWTVVEQD
ncbi:MAG TPA: hypothetical protein VNZ58_10380, partial [Thermomicrobiales bacterium]|nr:hypothetical protein [Thermomicrobiales bacterium]